MQSDHHSNNRKRRASFWGALRAALALALAAGGGASAAPAETVIYTFTGGSDGAYPGGGLTVDGSGNLYGTTSNGGASGLGVVFKLAPGGSETVLHSFTGAPSDGAIPQAGLIAGGGNLYGTTTNGGASGNGVVFKRSPHGTSYKVLYSFCRSGPPCSDGAFPAANLISDSSGNLYGTTARGGAVLGCNFPYGCGVVFKLSPLAISGGAWTETVLYSFTGYDGSEPYAGLIADGRGNLYGTTSTGGASNAGAVFKLSPPATPGGAWTETVLYSFTGSDGAFPYAGLIADGSGNLYGTTLNGGAFANGVVFKLAPDGTERVPHSFSGASDGRNPAGGLIADASGNLYGTTIRGGVLGCNPPEGCGVVFKLSPPAGSTWTETVLHYFNMSDGSEPTTDLLADASGNLYGTTTSGSWSNKGVVRAGLTNLDSWISGVSA